MIRAAHLKNVCECEISHYFCKIDFTYYWATCGKPSHKTDCFSIVVDQRKSYILFSHNSFWHQLKADGSQGPKFLHECQSNFYAEINQKTNDVSYRIDFKFGNGRACRFADGPVLVWKEFICWQKNQLH